MASDPVDPALSHGWRHAAAPRRSRSRRLLPRSRSRRRRRRRCSALRRRRRRRALRRTANAAPVTWRSRAPASAACAYSSQVTRTRTVAATIRARSLVTVAMISTRVARLTALSSRFCKSWRRREKVARARGDTAVQTSADRRGTRGEAAAAGAGAGGGRQRETGERRERASGGEVGSDPGPRLKLALLGSILFLRGNIISRVLFVLSRRGARWTVRRRGRRAWRRGGGGGDGWSAGP